MAADRIPWSRDEISSCNCDEKPFIHVHCKCWNCQGRAVHRSTELRHWRGVCISSTCTFGNTSRSLPQEEQESVCGAEDMDIQQENDEWNELPSVVGTVPNCPSRSDSLDSNSCTAEPVTVTQEEITNPLKKIVVKAVLNAMAIMEDSGVSIKTFEDILDNGKTMLLTSVEEDFDVDILSALWPKKWSEVQTLLKEEGFEDVKEYSICICREIKTFTRSGKSHTKYEYSRKWSIMQSKDELCSHCGKKGYIKYYYLGLNAKVKNWFRSEGMCRKLLSHWGEREHWLGRSASWPVKKEIWDGKRWLDLQWFWDPNQRWTLPTRCVNCKAIISTQKLSECPKDDNGLALVDCPECFETFSFQIKTTTGSPLNLAFIGHWDAWQPFRTSLRSCGSIEISVANMYKEDRAHVDEVYVVGFVPSTSVPNDVPEHFDPFLEPLMNDLSSGFIDGFQVPYPSGLTISNYEPGEMPTVRVLLLCWTADHPGQCEFGKFLNQGKCGCRRCKVSGKQSEHSYHYYYGDNRFHCRYPWESRDVELEQENFYDLDNETRTSVRKRLSSDKGFTGTSLLHKYLYPLYGFDVLKHTVIDIFHTIPLNLCKNQVQRLLELELLDKSYLDEQIKNFPWTTELKTGRLPVAVGRDGKGLGFWKAEGFQKFAYPMLECILEGKLQNVNELEILCSVARFTELHFNSGRDGWNEDMIKMHKVLAKRINVKVEETQGLDMCTISLHNLLHVDEDIQNFSATDNYWCAVFERAVKDYVKRSNNCKGVEGTFAKAEARREFLKSLQEGEFLERTESNDTSQV